MISDFWKRRISRFMQLSLVLIFVYGVYMGSSKVIINSAVGLAVTFSPALLRRNYDIVLNPWLSLWITSAVFFHALGSSGLYSSLSWWDHLTHAFSASVVAGIGYTSVRMLDLHVEEVKLPDRFMFVFILMTVIAFGVVWELFEYGLDIIATVTELDMPLAQHGLKDTMKDMMFNTVGAAIVAVFGQAYLSSLSQSMLDRINGD